ncbi:MAG: MBL fold metallo-hydrolase [Candidatus Symbiobacter sp.]|nr:MBL fold metallo-hydrolase [Candidatus Symbiobacter sp.]
MKVTILGCGPSGGVPRIGGDWGQCDKTEPRNRRRRAAIAIESHRAGEAKRCLLVDTGPDLRAQLLDAEIGTVDAIIWTHAHGDHVNGIDDVRQLNRNGDGDIPAYAHPQTLAILKRGFAHVFQPVANLKIDPVTGRRNYIRPSLIAHELLPRQNIAGFDVVAFPQDHGFGVISMGLRVGDFAYSTDVKNLDEAAFAALAGVKIWVLDGFSEIEHPTHAHLSQCLDWIARVKPDMAYLTHMDFGMDYQKLCHILPPHVRPAYDGLVIEMAGEESD